MKPLNYTNSSSKTAFALWAKTTQKHLPPEVISPEHTGTQDASMKPLNYTNSSSKTAFALWAKTTQKR